MITQEEITDKFLEVVHRATEHIRGKLAERFSKDLDETYIFLNKRRVMY